MIEEELRELKNIMNFTLKQTIKNVNSSFTKAPIDTGLMLRTTELVSITLNINTLDVQMNIKSQDYLKFVENGWGPNRKYGERRVREESIANKDVQAAISKLYAAITQAKIVSTLKEESIRKITYRV